MLIKLQDYLDYTASSDRIADEFEIIWEEVVTI
jgi:hypothetical protein